MGEARRPVIDLLLYTLLQFITLTEGVDAPRECTTAAHRDVSSLRYRSNGRLMPLGELYCVDAVAIVTALKGHSIERVDQPGEC